MAERRSYAEIWVVAAIILAVVLVIRVPRQADASASAGSAQVTTVMGGARRVVTDGGVRRTDVTTIMGGTRLDLRQVPLQPGEEMVVNLLTVMGGVTILVPDGWAVDTQAVPVLGGLKDTRVPAEWSDSPIPAATSPAPRLVLHGAVLMGGIRITS